MKNIPVFPYFSVQFDRSAQLFALAELDALTNHLARDETTDLIIISHGWNNNTDQASNLYEKLLSNAAELIAAGKPPGLAGRKFAVMGVLWPSKKFEDSALIASGAAGLSRSVDVKALSDELEELGGTFDAPDAAERIEQMKDLLSLLEDSDGACKEFANNARLLLTTGAIDNEDNQRQFMEIEPLNLFKSLTNPILYADTLPETGTGGAAGVGVEGAAGLNHLTGGILSGARRMLNLTTYYQMKERAGSIGATGVNPVLRSIRASYPMLRLHLVGHSFGGRLVTAAVAGVDDQTVLTANSMSLLQAAFSQHGFAKNWNERGGDGFFRRVVEQKAISGPVIITCTPNDTAVGILYAIASLVGGHDATYIGSRDSKYGGMGRNGAQKTPEAIDSVMVGVGGSYSLQPGKLHNLNADAFIMDHGDVDNPDVAYAVLSAVAAT